MNPESKTGPQKTSSPENTKNHPPESEMETISDEDAHQEAEKSVAEFSKNLNEKAKREFDNNPVIKCNGREYQQDELSEEYRTVGVLQKEVELIESRLEAATEVSNESQPGSREESIAYFKAQILARVRETKTSQVKAELDTVNVELRHPRINIR